MEGQTDGHGETSITSYNFVVGGIKMPEMPTQFVWQPFSIEFQGFVKKKKIKYIHQNLRYYETIEQIHFMAVKK